MPFGEWMKASPLKKMQQSPQSFTEEHEKIRKSLFQRNPHTATKEQESSTQDKVGETNEEQVGELLKALEKVEVNNKTSAQNATESQSTSQGKEGCVSVRLGNPVQEVRRTQGKTQEKYTNHTLSSVIPQNTTPNIKESDNPAAIQVQKSYTSTNPQSHNPNSHEITTHSIPKIPTTPHNKPNRPEAKKPTPFPNCITQKVIEQPYIIPQSPYTPTETLKKMVGASFPYTTNSSHATSTNTTHLNPTPPIRIKTEPISPKSQSQKSWKRKEPKHVRKQGSLLATRGKRKEDCMDIDLEYEQSSKKVRNSGSDQILSTAEAAEQPRRPL